MNGIHIVESFSGEQTGYSYNHACQIFTDIGVKAPPRLVGTREANKVANEVSQKKWMDMCNNMFPIDLPDDGDREKLWKADEGDEELPFS